MIKTSKVSRTSTASTSPLKDLGLLALAGFNLMIFDARVPLACKQGPWGLNIAGYQQ